MQATFEHAPSTLFVTLVGDLVGGPDAMSFSQSLREAIGGTPDSLKSVNVDTASVGFVNSSGLGMLLAARQAAKDAGANLSVLNPPKQLLLLLEVTRLTEILGVA